MINEAVENVQYARDKMKLRVMASSPDEDRKSSKGKKKGLNHKPSTTSFSAAGL